MSETQEFRLTLTQEEDSSSASPSTTPPFPTFMPTDPPAQGESRGPNPSRLLVAAVANCLSTSLLFSLRKF
jgi:organic hydroperoxide reductase OsmC/OhrA